MTVYQRLEYLLDPGTWRPLHTLYNPGGERGGRHQRRRTAWGASRAAGRWSSGSTTRSWRGRGCPASPRTSCAPPTSPAGLNVPLVWLVHCSGAKLPEQEKFYANRRGAGTPVLPGHAELEQAGIPVLAGIYGTNPAGGGVPVGQPHHPPRPQGRQTWPSAGWASVSGNGPEGRVRHRHGRGADCEDPGVHGASPRGRRHPPTTPPGSSPASTTRKPASSTGSRSTCGRCPPTGPSSSGRPSPRPPAFPVDDLYHLLPANQKEVYDFDEVLARLVDGSERLEFRPDYGPRGIHRGLQGRRPARRAASGTGRATWGRAIPTTATTRAMGGKLYRQGLVKMNEFVTLCGRDRLPVVWFQ